MSFATAILFCTFATIVALPTSGFYTALLGIGYSVATTADFIGTAGYARRLRDPNGDLAVSADFNGDGDVDQARILLNTTRGIAYVVATVMTKDKLDTYVVKTMSLGEANAIGIRVAPTLKPGARASGLTIFALDGSGWHTYDWAEENFVERASE